MRLIDADELVAFLHRKGGCDAPKDSWADGWDTAINETIAHVLLMQTKEAEHVKHGEWVYGENDIPHCSECGKEPKEISQYCPHCGANMEVD